MKDTFQNLNNARDTMLLMYIVFVWEIRTSQGSEGLVDYIH